MRTSQAMNSTMWSLVERAASERPGEILLVDDHGRSLSAADLRDEALAVASGLVELGIGPGDVVSWQLPTVLEAPVLLAACARLGVVQNPLIPLLREREIRHIGRQIRTRLLVVPVAWRGFAHAEMGRALGLEVLALELEGPVPRELRLPRGRAPLPPPPEDANDCRWIYYSSGTTAEPKGARHTDTTLIASSNGMVDALGVKTGDLYPIAWPFTHIGGIAMFAAVLRTGGTLALFDAFDPVATPVRMAAHRPTILGSATPFFRAYCAAQRRHGPAPLYPNVRAAVSGGAPTPLEVNREMIETIGVCGIAGAWGLTEFPIATSASPEDPAPGTTVGRPVAGVRVRVVDGELRLKGPQCFLGYVDAALDAAAFDGEGWFRTGDLGRIDEAGRIHVEGRQKDVILRNAENVSAGEVEEVLLRHPSVADVAVVGIPDPRTGERVVAVVVARADATVELSDIVAHCTAEGLARYKLPEQLELAERLPRNSMGKILKAEIRGALIGSRSHASAGGNA